MGKVGNSGTANTTNDHFETLPLPAFVLDAESRITRWNGAAERVTGVSASEVCGQPSWVGLSKHKGLVPLREAILSSDETPQELSVTATNGLETRVRYATSPAGPCGEKIAVLVELETGATGDQVRAKAAVEGSQNAVMMIDTDLVITYINPASRALLGRHESTFRTAFGSFEVDQLIGMCIDRFHKNPSHQRGLLGNSRNFPIQSDIQVAELVFALNVTETRTDEGELIGYTLEWADVTSARRDERQAAMLQSMVEGSGTSVMMCDLERRITYCNPAVRELLREHVSEFRKVFPGFDPDQLVGHSVDEFHTRPDVQARLIGDGASHGATVALGGLAFRLKLYQLTDAQGQRIGSAVEWNDATPRAMFAREVESLVEALTQGNLDFRGDAESLDSEFAPIMSQMNEIVATVAPPVQVAAECVRQLARGEQPSPITEEYQGAFQTLRDNLNALLRATESVTETASRIAEGDLTVEVAERSPDDALMHALSRMVADLNNVLSRVAQSADHVTSSSSEMTLASGSLADNATKAAASLEEINASMQTMATQTKHNAENADEARSLANAARDSAQVGDSHMKNMVEAMGEIDEAAQSISKIIKVIDEIAFQTNLLALNAAVEAARAGVHGKGFAVVAEEVRNLAARSAQAAKETTELIEGSMEKVSHGSRIAESTATALGEIVQGIAKVTDLVAEIAAASNEQAAGLREVNDGLSQVDSVTQQNTAASEELAATSQELSNQAKTLSGFMERFQLRQEEQPGFDLPAGLPPEVMALLQQYLTPGRGGRPSIQPTSNAPLAGNGNGRSHPANRTHSDSLEQVISLNDPEFGRY